MIEALSDYHLKTESSELDFGGQDLPEQCHPQKIRQLFQESTSLRVLATKLRKLGIVFMTGETAEVIVKARRLWWSVANLTEGAMANEHELKPTESTILPASVVEKDGIRYEIHGIVHPSDCVTSFWRELVKKNILKWLAKGEHSVCEQYFVQRFALPDAKEIDDVTFAATNTMWGKHQSMGLANSAGVIINEVMRAVMWHEMARNSEYLRLLLEESMPETNFTYFKLQELIHSQFIPLITKAITQWPSFLELRQVIRKKLLPQPLQIECERLILTLMQEHINKLPEERRQPFQNAYVFHASLHSPKREYYIAKRSLDYAREISAQTLHIIVGLNHELAINYYLKRIEPHQPK